MINTAMWGEPNTWQLMATLQNVDFDVGEWIATYNAKIKYSSEIPTLYNGVSDDILSMEIPIPKDVTFWGINKNAAYVKNWYITPIKDDTDIIHSSYADSLPVTEEIEELDYVPFILYYNQNHNQDWIPPYTNGYEEPQMFSNISSMDTQDTHTSNITDLQFSERDTIPQDVNSRIYKYLHTSPVMDFDYRAVILIIGVVDENGDEYSLNGQYSDWNINKIKAITFTLQCGSNRYKSQELETYFDNHPSAEDDWEYLPSRNIRDLLRIGLLNQNYIPYEQIFDLTPFTIEENSTYPWQNMWRQNVGQVSQAGYRLLGVTEFEYNDSMVYPNSQYQYNRWYGNGNANGVSHKYLPDGTETDLMNNTSADNILAWYQGTGDPERPQNLGICTGDMMKIKRYTNAGGSNSNPRYRMEIDWESIGIENPNTESGREAFKDYVRRQAAYLGFWFYDGDVIGGDADDIDLCKLDDLDPDDPEWFIPTGIHIPLFDENGVTTGEYLSGEDCVDAPNYPWRDNLRETIHFNPGGDEPEPEGDPELPPDDDITPDHLNSSTYNSGIRYYKISGEDLEDMIDFINQYVSSPDTSSVDFKGVDPWNYVVSCMLYPFDLSNTVTSNLDSIVLGGVDTGVDGYKCILSWGSYNMYDFGTKTVNASTVGMSANSFLNYLPYLKMYMQVPYCGTVELDPIVYWNRPINVKIAVDIPTGSCTAFIMVSGIIQDTIDGNCGMQLPLTTIAMGTYQNTIAQTGYAMAENKINGTINSASFISNFAGNLVSGNVGGALSTIWGEAKNKANTEITDMKLDYQLNHTAPQVGTIGTASPANNFIKDTTCKIIVLIPKYLEGYNAETYGKTVGYATCENVTLGSKSGYTQVSDIKLSNIICTDTEKSMLSNLCKSGIYL